RGADDDDATAHGAPRTNPDRRHLRRVDAKQRVALRTRNVHLDFSPPLSDRTPAAPWDNARSGSPGRSVTASVRRSIEYTEPGSVFAYFFISVASALTCAACVTLRRSFVTTPMDTVINGTR